MRFRHTLATLAALTLVGSLAADEVRGTLARLDLDKNELRVELRRGEAVTVALDAKTLVLFGSTVGKAADLSAGRRVRVEFETRDGVPVATVVRSFGRPLLRPVPAAELPRGEPRLPPGPGDAITGILQRVSQADREVVVIGPGAQGPETETTIAVPTEAKVIKDGKPAALDGLKEGDTVAIRAEKREGRLIAVELQAGAGAKLSAAPTAPRGEMLPRLRQALKIADAILRQMEKDGGPQP